MRTYIIVPAYNEQKRILETLEDYGKTLFKKYKSEVRIVVVSDSTDNTNRIVESYAKKHRGQVKLLRNKERKGKGAALIKGLGQACNDSKTNIVGFADSDLSVNGTEIANLIENLKNGEADGVIASRYVRGSVWIGRQKLSRHIASRGYNLLVRVLFGFPYHDTQCGAKFFKKKAICSILKELALTDMSFDLDLLYKMRRGGFGIAEVPVKYRWFREGSTLRLKRQAPQMFAVALGYRMIKSPLNAIVPLALKGAVYNFFKGW